MNGPATKQDLCNQEIQFDMLRANMNSQFTQTRAEMLDQFSKVFAMFDTMLIEWNKTLFKIGAFHIATMIAMLGIDRLWL